MIRCEVVPVHSVGDRYYWACRRCGRVSRVPTRSPLAVDCSAADAPMRPIEDLRRLSPRPAEMLKSTICQYRGAVVKVVPRDIVHCGCSGLKLFECRLYGGLTVSCAVNDEARERLYVNESTCGRSCYGCGRGQLDLIAGASDFLATIPAYDAMRFVGQGIVMSVGGAVLQANAYVVVRFIRQFGCSLPIEIWYDGRTESDAIFHRVMQPFGVSFVDAVSRGFRGWPHGCQVFFRDAWVYPRHSVHGYALKVFAILRSRFREIIFVDADNFPVQNVGLLLADTSYQQHGHIFWPDSPDADNGPDLAKFGVEQTERFTRGLESGQMVLDKSRCWRELNLVDWYNTNAHQAYRWAWGDKDCFLAAWLVCGTALNVAHEGRSCDRRAIEQLAPDGTPLFYHRAGASKLRLDRDNPPIPGYQYNKQALAYLDEYRRTYSAT